MSKKAWISISIIAFVIGLLLILFGAVFCVRNQHVMFSGDRVKTLAVTSEQVVATADIDEGSPIFFIDKQTAVDKVERAFPYIKVVHLKTTSPITIEFQLRERIAMYYTKFNENFILLDEELKVLELTSVEPDMTYLDFATLGITVNTVAGEFVGTSEQRDIAYNLFVAMYDVATFNGEYLTRDDIKDFMQEISVDTRYTLTKHYNRLIVKTSLGITLDIAEPETELEYKLNILMSTLDSDELTAEQKASGTLKYYLTQDNEAKAGYFNADV